MRTGKVNENNLFESADECLDRCTELQYILVENSESEKMNSSLKLCQDCIDLCPMLSVFIIRQSVLAVEVGQSLRQACLLLSAKLKELNNTSSEIKSCIKSCQKCADTIESYYNRVKINSEIKQYKAA